MLLGVRAGDFLLVFGAAFLAAYLLYRRRKPSGADRNFPPCLPSLPVVGSLPFLPTKMEALAEFCVGSTNKYGKIFSFYAGSKYDVDSVYLTRPITITDRWPKVTSLRAKFPYRYCSKNVSGYRHHPRSVVAYSSEVAHRAVQIR